MKQSLFLLFSLLFSLFSFSQCAYKGGKPDFLNQVLCKSDYKILQGKPLSNKHGDVSSVKLVYHLQSDKLYFLQSVKYKLHYEFCTNYLHAYENLQMFNYVEYSDFKSRKFVLANVNHYEGSDIYTLEFFADDKVTADLILKTYNKIKENAYFGNNLSILINSPKMAEKIAQFPSSIKRISAGELYESQVYQPMNQSHSYGFLRKVSANDFAQYPFSKHDIILSDGLPNEFPICEGMITTCFQTPLCHVNVLSSNRGTPNCAFRNAWDDKRVNNFVGKLIYYSVRQDTFILRVADTAEANSFWRERTENQVLKKVKRDLSYTKITDVTQIRQSDVAKFGGKAANFGELSHVKIPGDRSLPIPEGGFAIPIFYYQQHIESNGIQSLINKVLADKNLQNDGQALAKSLKKIQDSIKHSPINPVLLKMVVDKIRSQHLPYKSYRFRSSTNAEDIPGFNGAGLYTSKTGILDDDTKTIEKAIKAVWASTWNLRAFQERSYFNIDHSMVGMGVLVHRAFGDEAANGVAITANLYRPDYPSYTINAQVGETSVVLPESDTIRCDQFLVHLYSPSSTRDEISVEYISNSNLNNGNPVLSEEEITLLTKYLTAVKKHFYFYSKGTQDYDNYALDIEFKFDKESRKLYIKQARAYRQ